MSAGRTLLALTPRVEQYARRTATAVKLEELYRWGCGDVCTRLKMAQFLHQEIAIRNAQLCKEIHLLPFGLAETHGASEVMSTFSSHVDRLAEFPQPSTAKDDQQFTALLREVLEDQCEVELGRAVREVRQAMGEERYEDIRPEVSLILDRLFIKRIGLRFLLEHHIESEKGTPGTSGIIHSEVSVGPILRSAARTARQACRDSCGKAPEVTVTGDGQEDVLDEAYEDTGSSLECLRNLSEKRHFTYVPTHLRFMCSELLKNACEAVAREHHALAPEKLPPVRAIFAHGEEEVGIKISDEGGGIARSEMHLAWSYYDNAGKWTSQGSGLILARLHARYYGGDLVVKSMEGFGTDAYLFLNRLGQNCENLPHGVRVSPAQRDSSVGEDACISLDSLGAISEREATFLEQRLEEHRAAREAESGNGASSTDDFAPWEQS